MIYPDWGTAPETNESPLPLFREWAVDWESGALALRGGEPYTLEGDEAVKLWVRLALDARCARWRYSAHSGDYGNELAALLGRSGDAGIRESLLKRTITETLLVCPYITGVEGFSFEHRADAKVFAAVEKPLNIAASVVLSEGASLEGVVNAFKGAFTAFCRDGAI